ncbi:hypothetical protein D7V97_24450 [Corallococcus sp. CA053C]|uniref:hypothetical protein n=1 Tax=Corallococcus sp. CA053C TaxID=2316732 RepID=UPI000EA2A1DF|nr:hypothetical protein [Corallococcus sp. CA053C]RKH05131.1 hypothetical protein D7V97_24450 [Corallococcus sp. CA053C]
MISSLLRRVITTVQTAVTKPPAPQPPQPTPAAAPYFQDALEQGRKSPVNLSGFGNVPSVAARAPVEAGVTASGGSEQVGPELIHLDAGWTPQGQGYDARHDEVLTTYYNDSGSVLLSVQDKDSGKETHQVRLGGLSPNDPAGPPTHGGGVSTDGEFVYVSDTDHLYVYKREDIEKAEADGTEVSAFQVMEVPSDENLTDPATGIGLVSAGSYMTVKDGYAYVGGYSEDGDGKVGAVWRYEIDEKTGAIIEDSRQGPIRAPDRAQGMTVVDGGLLFTTGDQKLVYQPFDSSADTFSADIEKRVDISNGLIDPYAQGLNVIDGELWVTYESGSDKYRDKVDKPRENIQRIPLESLNLAAGCLTPDDLEG